DDEYPPNAVDFRPFLARIRSRGASSLGMCLTPGQSGIVARQAAELGLRLNIFGCEALEDTDEVRISRNTLAGAWYVTAGVDDTFRERFQSAHGANGVLSGAAVHYDLAELLVDVLRADQNAEEMVRSLLQAGPRKGALGSFTVVERDDDRFFEFALV